MPSIRIRPLGPGDLEVVPRAFAAVNWPGKPAAMYRDYLRQQESGLRQVLVATLEHTFAGYVTVCRRAATRRSARTASRRSRT